MLEPLKGFKGVFRLRANNPSVMTGTGTNTYFIIEDQDAFVIDPGPCLGEHVQAIFKALEGYRLKGILLTHMHPDHSPAANAIKMATGAPIYGIDPDPADTIQDHSVSVDHSLKDNEVLTLGTLRVSAILTPGHTSNHVCFLLEDQQILFAGDHVMQGSTVVIVPPYGDMQAYLQSLTKLFEFSLSVLAPAHGELIRDAHEELQRLIDHRLAREAKVLDGMQQISAGSLEEITKVVYADVHPSLHQLASQSLHAHLIKLVREGQVTEFEGVWRLLAERK